MADSIPDLWGDEIEVEEVSPAIILDSQASILQKKTNNFITAELIRRRSGTVTELFFDIKSKAARHRSRILECRYLDDQVYPAWITSSALPFSQAQQSEISRKLDLEYYDWGHTRQANSQEDFFEIISKVLKSVEIKTRISSMIAKINEANRKLDHLIVEEVVGEGDSQ